MIETAERHALAQAHLQAADPVMARLIDALGPCLLGARPRPPFEVLAISIINQQLSTKAADTIQRRLEAVLGTAGGLPAAALATADPQQLRSAGLSGAKTRWLIELGQREIDGRLGLEAIADMDDADAIVALDALPGIGRWTAEMLLIFAFGRMDVFAMGDAGLRRSIGALYAGGQPLDDAATQALSARWSPYRSVASWYLWRAADGNVGSWG